MQDRARNGEILEVVYPDGTLVQFDNTGAHLLGGGVKSVSVAFDLTGHEVLAGILLDGTLVQLDSNGLHHFGGGLISVSIAFSPLGEVFEVVTTDGTLMQAGPTGIVVLGTGVRSATAAFCRPAKSSSYWSRPTARWSSTESAAEPLAPR